MSGKSAVDVARAFLDVLWAETPPGDAALLQALDRLLADAHDVLPANAADIDDDPPKGDWQALYREIGTRFSDYGFYSAASPLEHGEPALLTGDAIDDLADLTSDLREVVWRGERFGPGDAAWFFRLMHFHWGNHARELALFLHARSGSGGVVE